MIAYGTGTSLEGHIAALEGGVSIDLGGMDAVLEVNAEDLDARVEAGVTRTALNARLRDSGLFFPIDPGADASLGGMTATRASGTNAVRYGTMRENVLGLTVVTADGRVVHTGGRARKSSAGYDLTRLFVGSEGTLGIITEVQLRLHGHPRGHRRRGLLVRRPRRRRRLGDHHHPVRGADRPHRAPRRAADARLQRLLQPRLPRAPDALLRVPRQRVRRRRAVRARWPASPPTSAARSSAGPPARRSAPSSGPPATTPTGPARASAPGAVTWATDVCVPISRLAECVLETKRDIEAEALLAPVVGHVGDGNFHLTFLLDPDDPAEFARAEGVSDRMVARALRLGGTCTGEHGIGWGKMRYLAAEHAEGIELMQRIKRAFDPENLFNPGKIVPFDPLPGA